MKQLEWDDQKVMHISVADVVDSLAYWTAKKRLNEKLSIVNVCQSATYMVGTGPQSSDCNTVCPNRLPQR